MHQVHQRPQDPLHDPTEMRPRDRTIRQGKPMLFTAFAQRLALKFPGVIDIQAFGFAMDRPGDLHAQPLQPGLLGHGRMRQTEPYRGGGWRVEGETYSRDTPTEHVDSDGERGPAKRPALLGIHNDEVDQGMLDLKHLERRARLGCAAWRRAQGLHRSSACALLQHNLRTDRTDPRADRIRRWDL